MSVCPELPIEGVGLLLGNDIADGKVTPSLEVLSTPQRHNPSQERSELPGLFPACVVTRAQASNKKRLTPINEVNICDLTIISAFSEQPQAKPTADTRDANVFQSAVFKPDLTIDDGTSPPMSRAQLCQVQRADPTLVGCFVNVKSNDKASGKRINYCLDDDLLIHRWSPTR